MTKKTIEQEINEFLIEWDRPQMESFIRYIDALSKLYHVDENGDWVEEAVGEENAREVRVIQTIYLISRLAEFHAGRLAYMNVRFKKLWMRLEKEGVVEERSNENRTE